MKITKKEFGKVARKEAYEELERAIGIDPGPGDALEGVMLGLTVIFLMETKKSIFGEDDEADISREILVNKMSGASAKVLTEKTMSKNKDPKEGFMDLLLGISLASIHGTIGANIVKHYFKEEE